MAKWGEGDPRWIVEEREDATNVNNWHWSEKNCTTWSKERIKELLKNVILASAGPMVLRVTDSVEVTGEAIANNRKGKLIFFYELNVKFDWEGILPNGEKVKGCCECNNLSEENELSELEFSFSTTTSVKGCDILRELFRNVGKEEVRKRIGIFLADLKNEYSKDLIKPIHKKNEDCKKNISLASKNDANSGQLNNCSAKGVTKNKEASLVSFTTIEDSVELMCSAQDAYQLFTDSSKVSAWTQAPCKINPTPGEEWGIFNFNVEGKFLELIKNEKIIQTWRESSWPQGHYSTVILEFKQGDSTTRVNLKQTNVPLSKSECTKSGWRSNYWARINSVFGICCNLGSL